MRPTGWQQKGFDDSGWKTAVAWAAAVGTERRSRWAIPGFPTR